MKIFDEIESEVQSYARSFPRVFHKAQGEHLYDEDVLLMAWTCIPRPKKDS